MSSKSSIVSMPSLKFRDTLRIDNYIYEPTWDDLSGLGKAYQEARLSRHTTQVGAAVAGVTAHNNPEIGSHAESWAISTCARLGVSTYGQTMYAPWASCVGCAVTILGAGISRVVTHFSVMDLTPHRWQSNVQKGIDLLVNNGVQVDLVMQQIGGITITFDGKEVEV